MQALSSIHPDRVTLRGERRHSSTPPPPARAWARPDVKCRDPTTGRFRQAAENDTQGRSLARPATARWCGTHAGSGIVGLRGGPSMGDSVRRMASTQRRSPLPPTYSGEMRVAELMLNCDVRWKIHPESPPLLPEAIAGFQLLNPLLNEHLSEPSPIPQSPMVGLSPDGSVVFRSPRLLFLVPEDYKSGREMMGEFTAVVPMLLAWLRVLKWQVQISNAPQIIALSLRPAIAAEALYFDSPPQATYPSYVLRDLLETAASIEDLDRGWALATASEKPSLPLHLFADSADRHRGERLPHVASSSGNSSRVPRR